MVCGQNDCTPVQAYIKETKSGKVSLSWPIPNVRHHGKQGPSANAFDYKIRIFTTTQVAVALVTEKSKTCTRTYAKRNARYSPLFRFAFRRRMGL